MNRGIHLRIAAALSNDWGPLLVDNSFGLLVGNLRQHHITRVTFDQSGDVGVPRSGDQIPFPVTGDRTIFD